jgi:hypothetical protein
MPSPANRLLQIVSCGGRPCQMGSRRRYRPLMLKALTRPPQISLEVMIAEGDIKGGSVVALKSIQALRGRSARRRYHHSTPHVLSIRVPH